jgi:hypothetical protein
MTRNVLTFAAGGVSLAIDQRHAMGFLNSTVVAIERRPTTRYQQEGERSRIDGERPKPREPLPIEESLALSNAIQPTA